MSNEQSPDSPFSVSGDVAIIGEGTSGRTEISIQVMQQIYHELTGKTEDVSRSYTDAFQIERADLEQLHHRLQQTLEQFDVKAQNCGFKIYYVDDRSQSCSSFERFHTFSGNSTSAVESLFITYDFLLLLPKLSTVQPYTLTVRLASRIAIEKKMRRDLPFHYPKILRIMGGRTAVVTVKHVDYVVARTLLNAMDEWFQTLNKSKHPRFFEYIRKHSESIPIVCRFW